MSGENEFTVEELNAYSLEELIRLSVSRDSSQKQKNALIAKKQGKERKAKFDEFKKAALKLIPKALRKCVGKIHYGHEHIYNKRPWIIINLPDARAQIRLNFRADTDNDGKILVTWSEYLYYAGKHDRLPPIEIGYPSNQFSEFAEDDNKLYVFKSNWQHIGYLSSEFSPNLLLEAIYVVRSPDMKDKYEKNAEEINSLNEKHLAKAQAEKDRIAKIEESGGRIVSDTEFRAQIVNSPPLDQIAYWLTIIGKEAENFLKNYHRDY